MEPSTELSGAEPTMEPWGDELSNAEPIIESSGAVPIINRQGH